MGNELKQRAMQILRRFEQAYPRTQQADNAAVDMAALLQDLVAEQQPASVPDELPVNVLNAVAESLYDTYICGRVWSAWHYGTMREDDFTPAGEDLGTVVSVAKAAITAWIAAAPAAPEQPASVPVLIVECEPDYWSGGHYYEGSKPYIAPTKIWKLPIGTKLYTAPAARDQSEQNLEMVRDAERYQWLRAYNTAKHPAVTEAFFLGDENLDAAIDAAIAAEKGGAA